MTESKSKSIRMILWFALLMSNIMMAGIAFNIIFPKATGSLANALPIFASIAIVIAFVSKFLYGKARGIISDNSLSTHEKHTKSFVLFILSWAIGESISILGLIYGMMGPTDMVHYGYYFFAIGIGLHLTNRP